jgi:hypothetical protein
VFQRAVAADQNERTAASLNCAPQPLQDRDDPLTDFEDRLRKVNSLIGYAIETGKGRTAASSFAFRPKFFGEGEHSSTASNASNTSLRIDPGTSSRASIPVFNLVIFLAMSGIEVVAPT